MTRTSVIRQLDEAARWIERVRQRGRRVGLVPTMGGLHEGHLSLVREAGKSCDDVAVTIFVNPTQFAPGEDFDRYPRTWDADLQSLEQMGVAIVFAPSAADMFPIRSTTFVEPPAVSADLEGEYRPGHFRGVATVVLKLFHILPAQVAFFGEKDFQQCLVVRDMVRDLNVPIQLQFCDTVREADGLAMSSRNRYLSAAERHRALALSRALARARELVDLGETEGRVLEQAAIDVLATAGIDRVDYVSLRDADTFERLRTLGANGVLLIAAHVGATRLIDNCRLRATTTQRASG
jgi:pantoate--beta-alanine ligase